MVCKQAGMEDTSVPLITVAVQEMYPSRILEQMDNSIDVDKKVVTSNQPLSRASRHGAIPPRGTRDTLLTYR